MMGSVTVFLKHNFLVFYGVPPWFLPHSEPTYSAARKRFYELKTEYSRGEIPI
jgi:hypothetical protein